MRTGHEEDIWRNTLVWLAKGEKRGKSCVVSLKMGGRARERDEDVGVEE